ncbi:hepatitis A virus cellular receptor 1-like [Mytilus edulis]|uniref:hepatitis A virus cellular receptor 1-like n=1 Tax=Mytilus edulis TaxID=6550 RepID=UPI0039EF87CE
MDLKHVIFLVFLIVPAVSDSIFDDWFDFDFDSSEEVNDLYPVIDDDFWPTMKYSTGVCYFRLDQTYHPREFVATIKLDSMTLDMTAKNYQTFNRDALGMEYKLTNLRTQYKGFRCVRFKISHFGWRVPNYWCYMSTGPTNLPPTTLSLTSTSTTPPITSTSTKPPSKSTTPVPTSTSTTQPSTSTTKHTKPSSSTSTTTTPSAATTTINMTPSYGSSTVTTVVTPTTPPTTLPTTTIEPIKTTSTRTTTTVSSTSTTHKPSPTTTISSTSTTQKISPTTLRTSTTTSTKVTLPTRPPPPEPA